MTFAIEAAPIRLALETKAVADARRIRAAFAHVGPAVQRLGAQLAEAFSDLARVVTEAGKKIAAAFTLLARAPEGYYWRDGRLRRDHGFFRRRAKLRRAALKAARRVQ